MLHIHNLHAATAGKAILKGFSHGIGAGETYAAKGPHGAGKSTLARQDKH